MTNHKKIIVVSETYQIHTGNHFAGEEWNGFLESEENTWKEEKEMFVKLEVVQKKRWQFSVETPKKIALRVW